MAGSNLQNVARRSAPFPANQPFINSTGNTISANSIIDLSNPTFNSVGQVVVSALAAANVKRAGFITVAVANGSTGTAVVHGNIGSLNTNSFSVNDLLKVSSGTAFARATAAADNVVAEVLVQSATVGVIYFDGESLNKEIISSFVSDKADTFVAVINTTGSTIAANSLVNLISPGFNSSNQLDITTTLSGSNFIRSAIITEDLPNGEAGEALTSGYYTGFDTSGLSVGDRIYAASVTTFGKVTRGNENVLGDVITSAASGRIWFNGLTINKEKSNLFVNSLGDRHVNVLNRTGSSLAANRIVPIDFGDQTDGSYDITAAPGANEQFVAYTTETVAGVDHQLAIVEGELTGLNLNSGDYNVGDQLKVSNATTFAVVTAGSDNVVGEVLTVNSGNNTNDGTIYFNGIHVDFHASKVTHDYGFIGFDNNLTGGTGANTQAQFNGVSIGTGANLELGFVVVPVSDNLTPVKIGENVSNSTTGTFTFVSKGRYRIEIPEIRYAYQPAAAISGAVISTISIESRSSAGVLQSINIHGLSTTHAANTAVTSVSANARTMVQEFDAGDDIKFYFNLENNTGSAFTTSSTVADNNILLPASEVSIELIELL